MTRRLLFLSALLAVGALTLGACARRTAPVVKPQPAPTGAGDAAPVPSAPPAAPRGAQAVTDSQLNSTPALTETALAGSSLEDLNRDSPLRPAFFPVDSFELDATARTAVAANAEVLRQNPRWVISIEGHCDERGTTEYNLALGERRAMAAKAYLASLGIPESRMKTVSYGDEYPFDRGHTDAAWSSNRRAHFVISAK